MKRTLWLGVLGSALVVAIILVTLRPDAPADSEPVAKADPPRERSQPAALVQESLLSKSSVAAATEATANAALDPRSPAPVLLPHQTAPTPMIQALKDAVSSAPRGAEPGEFLRSPPPQMVEGERAFAAEPVDPQWSTATEAKVLGKIAQINGLKVIDLQVECRTTMCRVQLIQPRGNPTSPPFPEMVESFGLKPQWLISVNNPSGGFTTVAYLLRGEPAAP